MHMSSTPPSSPTAIPVAHLNSDGSQSKVAMNIDNTIPGTTPAFVNYLVSKLRLNTSQMQAIEQSTQPSISGVTLIQGPPGTGKTSTLLGILNAIQLRVYDEYYTALVNSVLTTPGMTQSQYNTDTHTQHTAHSHAIQHNTRSQ